MVTELNKEFIKLLPGLSKACDIGTPGESLLDFDKVRIMKHCLDKQRIEETLTNFLKEYNANTDEVITAREQCKHRQLLIQLDKLNKELGLD